MKHSIKMHTMSWGGGIMRNAYRTLNKITRTVNLVVESTWKKLDLMEPSTYLMEGPWKIDGWNLKKVNGTMGIVGGIVIIIYGTMSIIGGTISNGHDLVEPYKEYWTMELSITWSTSVSKRNKHVANQYKKLNSNAFDYFFNFTLPWCS